MSGFDPYYTWLGIPKAAQPPHHYRLLGIQVFETEPQVIDNAADRLMIHLRTFSAGPNGVLSQKLLNEVATARSVLQNAKLRPAYDAELQARLKATAPQPQAPQVITQYVPVPVHVPVPMQTAPLPLSAPPTPGGIRPILVEQPAVVAEPAPDPTVISFGSASSSFSRRRKSSSGEAGGAILGLAKVAVGGMGGVAIAVLGVWLAFRSDPFGLFEPPPAPVASRSKKAPVAAKVDVPAKTAAISATKPAKTESAKTKASSPIASVNTVEQPPQSPKTVSVPADPSEPPPDSEPAPAPGEPTQPLEPAELPPATVVLHPVPANDQQQAKLAELKQLYEAEFEAGFKPAGREGFPAFLLATADKLKSDPVGRFVLLREAYNRLVALKDFPAAAEVIDQIDQDYEVDPFKLRLHLLAEVSAQAKQPAERRALSACAANLAEQALGRWRIDEAEKFVRIAEGQARASGDAELRTKMTALKIRVEKLAEQFGPTQRARQALVVNPNDPAAALVDGRHRCLVEGDWSGGLPLLARCSDALLAAAAAEDLMGVTADLTAAALGDRWHEIAESDKDLAAFHARASHWYRQALPKAAPADRARIEQRIAHVETLSLPQHLLAEPGAAPPAAEPLPPFSAALAQTQAFDPIDLMSFLLAKEINVPSWSGSSNGTLVSQSSAPAARIPAHYAPPREYRVVLTVRRQRSVRVVGGEVEVDASRRTGALVIGLVGPKTQFLAVVDLPMGSDFGSLMSLADAQPTNNPTLRKSGFANIPDDGREATIVCEVRRRSVTVQINGTPICRYEGELDKLVLPKEWAVSDAKAPFVGSINSSFEISSWRLLPVEFESKSDLAEPAAGFGNPPVSAQGPSGFFNR